VKYEYCVVRAMPPDTDSHAYIEVPFIVADTEKIWGFTAEVSAMAVLMSMMSIAPEMRARYRGTKAIEAAEGRLPAATAKPARVT